MKTYIVYVDGVEVGMIKAASHNAAEKKQERRRNLALGRETEAAHAKRYKAKKEQA